MCEGKSDVLFLACQALTVTRTNAQKGDFITAPFRQTVCIAWSSWETTIKGCACMRVRVCKTCIFDNYDY